ncbi:MAG: hypothetical protein ACJASQ_002008 [Crocinitomicaceae bacterium]|jgi:hypothetical protein
MEATKKASIEQGNHKMVLQARDYAVDFYIRLGYTKLEPPLKWGDRFEFNEPNLS